MQRFAQLVRQLLEPDTIDYTIALSLLEDLQTRKDIRHFIFDTLSQIALTSDRQLRLNCISFIDFLIKNANKEFLTQLQQSPALLSLGDDAVVRDPYIHWLLCKVSEEWATALTAARVIQPQFTEWRRRLCSFRYRFVMNEAMISKFSADFSAAHELLSMFNQEIVTALVDGLGPDDEMLLEVLPNVNEIHRRLVELKQTMPDPYVIRIIAYLEEYCELCKLSYASFAREGVFDIDALAEMAGRGIPQPDSPPARTSSDLMDLGPTPAGEHPEKVHRKKRRRHSERSEKPVEQPPETPPPERPPPNMSGFEFADDVDDGGVSNAEFARFIDQISSRKK
jgi:hypothetical protein